MCQCKINSFSVHGDENNRFRVGKWKISSQSLDGQKLDTSQWIMPKDVPEPLVDVSSPKKARSLNAFSLENPGPQKTVVRGRHHIPNYSHLSHQTNDDRLLEGKF